VERALGLLATFSTAEPELSLTELSSRLDLSPSTTYRLLMTLQNAGYVEHHSQSGRYSLGVACLDLGSVFMSQLDLRDRVLPMLETLRENCKETIHLAVLDRKKMEVIYLEKLEGLLPIGMMGSRVGGRAPAHCTGLGKCLLAYLPDVEVRDFYLSNGMRSYTDHTITDTDQLLFQLAQIRERGYAIDNVEHEPDVKCLAAPVWNHRQVVVASVSVSGPEKRIDHLVAESGLAERLQVTAHEASRRMGYPG
jgi:IclR family KDG regulon transcriptional repressor